MTYGINVPQVTPPIETERIRRGRRTLPEVARMGPSLTRAWRDRELLLNLLLRDLRARYRRTAIGWGWSMLNPAATTLVYSIVFVHFLKVRPDPGNPSGMKVYAFYLLAGILPWNVMTNGVQQGAGALLGGAGLISKVSFAREHLVISTVLSLVVSLFVELAVLAAMELLTGNVMLHMVPVVFVLVVFLTLFTTGVALWIAALNLRYRDVQHITNVGFLVWFYLTPIIYPARLIPEHSLIFGVSFPVRAILALNPMARFILAFRNCFFDIRLPGLNTMLGLALMSVASFFAGYRYFSRRAPWFAEEL